jgi:predicted nucleic-acid-binding Zn-ribbon protein
MMRIAPCPNCGSENLYRSKPVSAGGGHAPNYLPGLGGFLTAARFRIVVCKACGLTRFFASAQATEKVTDAKAWERAAVSR